MRETKLAGWVLMSFALTACGHSTEGQGELGRMTFALSADYELTEFLDEVGIVTGHEQTLTTGLTDKGSKQVRHPGLITYRLEPSINTDVSFHTGNDQDEAPPFVTLTVHEPGNYRLEALLEGDVLDYMDLAFRRPVSLDVVSWIRPAGEDLFSSDTSRKFYTVEEGTQVALVPIPLDQDGRRLVGDYWMDVTFTPEWAAIHTANVLGVYEKQGVWGSEVTESLVFIEPAVVTVFVEDAANGLVDTIEVEVTERPQTE